MRPGWSAPSRDGIRSSGHRVRPQTRARSGSLEFRPRRGRPGGTMCEPPPCPSGAPESRSCLRLDVDRPSTLRRHPVRSTERSVERSAERSAEWLPGESRPLAMMPRRRCEIRGGDRRDRQRPEPDDRSGRPRTRTVHEEARFRGVGLYETGRIGEHPLRPFMGEGCSEWTTAGRRSAESAAGTG
jgi:hypothetical protein